MKILSVNAGSSSLKFALFELPENKELISGYFERIGGDSFYSIKIDGNKTKKDADVKNHADAIKFLIEELLENKIVSSLEEITGVGHRVVHGGEDYAKSAIIDDALLAKVEELSDLAPLHNPANITGIKAFREAMPNTPMVAVFDTAFHQTMDAVNYIYPLPYEWYENYSVRKYGFHGTSHKFIDKTISEVMNRDDLKVISCHIGSGASIASINAHKVVDTTMGFTPLAGVMMGTRPGDFDASIIPYIMEKENKTIAEVMDDLNKRSGLLGVSGVSNDSRDVEEAAEAGNERAKIAEEMCSRKIANYIAMYNNLLGGADVICFTAGLGENNIKMRATVGEMIASLGVKIDDSRNDMRGKLDKISTDDSKIDVYVVPTDEELMIAQDTFELI